jgi:chloride channel 7
MLSGGDGDVLGGIGMARLHWTRLPTTEADGASTSAPADDDLFAGAAVESLDYEVIENYAYREEQVRAARPSAGAVSLKPRSFPLLLRALAFDACWNRFHVSFVGCVQAQRSKFWVPYYVMLKWLFSLLIGVGEHPLDSLL